MSVRFVIGRAGTGKTHYCLQSVLDRVSVDPVDGPRLILLVPEQASYQMERTLVERAPQGVLHRAEVLSFRRLAFRVLEPAGAASRAALSDAARAMVLRHMVTLHRPQLRYYRRADRVAGLMERLGATVSELIQEAIAPDDLVRAYDSTTVPIDPNAAKLHDLQLIYRAYLDYLGRERVDPTQYLALAREAMPPCVWLHGAEVWVDGFASFMQQEALTLALLARLCSRMEISLLLDPRLYGASGRDSALADQARLFSRTLRTQEELGELLRRSGVAVETPILLSSHEPPRTRGQATLARMERTFFSQPEADAGAAVGGVEVAVLPNRRLEAEYAVSRVCRWVQEQPGRFRYRDLAIIVRDLNPYHEWLAQALRARNVPFFIDRRRPMAHHPLVELLRAACQLAAEDMPLDTMRLLLKTGLLPLATEAADVLENYLLAHGISGRQTWQQSRWTFAPRSALSEDRPEPSPYEQHEAERVHAAHAAVMKALGPWLAAAADGNSHTGQDWADAIRRWLGLLETDTTVTRWAQEAEARGDLDQAEEHRQVLRDVDEFLGDLTTALREMSLPVDELGRVVESGLAEMTLGLAPPMLDQVLVGAIERSRHPEIKAAVILGFNDGVFPQTPAEDSILNDEDRERLRAAGLRVRGATRERVLDESLLAYVAVTRPSEELVVTYAAADEEGRELRPSPYLEALLRSCGLKEPIVVVDPVVSRRTWDIVTGGDFFARIAGEFRARPAMGADDPTTRARWNELYESARGLAREHRIGQLLSGLKEVVPARLSEAAVRRLYGAELHTSVSQLESYAACPFKHFAESSLKLRPRPVAELEAVDVGRLHHAVLEDFVGGLTQRHIALADLSAEQLTDTLRESCARVAEAMRAGEVVSVARDRYVTRRMAGYLARVVRAQQRLAKMGQARTLRTEVPFGFSRAGALPGLSITTPQGRRIVLRGFIDRVDVAELTDECLGIVVDYKRSSELKLEASEVFHGLSLQLLAYALVVAEHGETLTGRPIRPVAALYVPMTPAYESRKHPSAAGKSSDKEEDAPLLGLSKPRGAIHRDGVAVLHPTFSEWSDGYGLYLKKDGNLGNVGRSDAYEPESFDALLRHTKGRMGSLADAMLDGDIAVRPVRLKTFTACSWCTMSPVCRIDALLGGYRFVEPYTRAELMAKLVGTSPSPDEVE